MKYCSHCGAELCDEAVICVKCGCSVSEPSAQQKTQDSALVTVIKVLLILSCVALGFTIIGLAWAIPMTKSIFRSLNNRQPISLTMKICTLIFIDVIVGILLLCLNDNTQQI